MLSCYHWKNRKTYHIYHFRGIAASLPKELQPELQRQVNLHQLDISNLSFGKIYQLAVSCLERLFFKDLMENRQPFKSACKKPHLKIKWSLIPNQRNPTGFSKGKIPSLPRTQKTVVVSYAKRKGILQKIAQISRQSPIIFSIIYKPPLSSLPMMIFSPCFQNKRVPMKKQSLLSKRQIQILPLT